MSVGVRTLHRFHIFTSLCVHYTHTYIHVYLYCVQHTHTHTRLPDRHFRRRSLRCQQDVPLRFCSASYCDSTGFHPSRRVSATDDRPDTHDKRKLTNDRGRSFNARRHHTQTQSGREFWWTRCCCCAGCSAAAAAFRWLTTLARARPVRTHTLLSGYSVLLLLRGAVGNYVETHGEHSKRGWQCSVRLYLYVVVRRKRRRRERARSAHILTARKQPACVYVFVVFVYTVRGHASAHIHSNMHTHTHPNKNTHTRTHMWHAVLIVMYTHIHHS